MKDKLIQAVYQSRAGDLNQALTVVNNLKCSECLAWLKLTKAHDKGYCGHWRTPDAHYTESSDFCSNWEGKA